VTSAPITGMLSGVEVPRHYGDPAAEYQAARNGVVVVDRPDRRLLRVYGRDPLRMVQGLVTNDLAGAPPGQGVYAAFLGPKGKMIADVRLFLRGPDVWAEVDAAACPAVEAHLRKFVPPLFARFEPADCAVISVYGPRSAELVRGVLGALPQRPEEDAFRELSADGFVARTAYAGVAGFDVVAPTTRLEPARAALLAAGARPMGHSALEVLRIEAGRPRWGAELTEDVIPLEAGLRQRAISETKGCYTGQEVIIRILHRGHVNRQLRGLLLGDVSAPQAGAELTRPGDVRPVGRITSACASPRLGQTIALGYVRREIEPGTELVQEGRPVRVVELPFPI
jgi:folate-binding protein YgfZ